MNIDKRWALLFAATAGVIGGAALALASRRQHQVAREMDHTSELKSWEDEGGSVAPAAMVAPPQP